MQKRYGCVLFHWAFFRSAVWISEATVLKLRDKTETWFSLHGHVMALPPFLSWKRAPLRAGAGSVDHKSQRQAETPLTITEKADMGWVHSYKQKTLFYCNEVVLPLVLNHFQTHLINCWLSGSRGLFFFCEPLGLMWAYANPAFGSAFQFDRGKLGNLSLIYDWCIF